MEKIRFGLIGCGFIGGLHAGVINKLPGAELVAVSDQDEEAGKRFAKKYGCRYYRDYRDLVADPLVTAVALCSPPGTHLEMTRAAASAGKHVLCEKPMDIDAGNAQAMVDACRDAGVRLGVIMQHRFDDAYLLLRRAIAQGKLGRVLWGASRTIWHRDEAYFSNPVRATLQYEGGGALMNQAIHYIDLLLHTLGDVESVGAKCRKLLHRQIETEDIGLATLQFCNGTLGTIEGTTLSYPGLYAELSVFGDKGSVIIRNDHLLFYYFESGKDEEFERALNPEKANALHCDPGIPDDSHRRQYEDFVAALRENREPLVTGEDGVRVIKVIKAIYRASEQKAEVTVNDSSSGR